MLKLLCERLVGNRIFAWCQSITPGITCHLQREKHIFKLERSGGHHLHQVIKFSFTSLDATWYYGLLI